MGISYIVGSYCLASYLLGFVTNDLPRQLCFSTCLDTCEDVIDEVLKDPGVRWPGVQLQHKYHCHFCLKLVQLVLQHGAAVCNWCSNLAIGAANLQLVPQHVNGINRFL
ncbi:hypothetical protein AVEN_35039-1 [Araneus ventricosus]|uniref:Uncharacterized protein n=1 Tax=Araneus ventricosus TaxID=182803 RepID=A0A4Y2RU80_ARAVE|nr:hypothetical protein AVEN_211014-1 [Araneus ventricosus]GBN79422.1 hypothetical protein AVEN_226119-1 [Araneus ventricosus]GBN80630.1 hypothetical protein AVEN_183452-1 [Araneus ventricosus]GBN80699.1 hypothetical protein AVEN_35039-1 [Araneus ventricosus]